VTWWRRESLHEKLAREGGLMHERDAEERARPPWDKVGIHGVPRPRRWDAVVTVEAPDVPGNGLEFVALPDGTLVADEEIADEALAPLAEAVERELEPPYRAEAVRRTEAVWAVAASSIDAARLPEATPGDELTMSVQGGGRTTLVDGREWLASLPALEELARARIPDGDYVVEASRIDGDLWAVRVSAL
jgi:hypothetical protein